MLPVPRSSRQEVPDPRLSQAAATSKSLLALQQGLPLPFPPFLFPQNNLQLQEAIKEAQPSLPAPALPWFRPGATPPGSAPVFPPGLLPPGLLDPAHAQALLSVMRGQLPGAGAGAGGHTPASIRPPASVAATNPPPPLDLTAADSPPAAKKPKRESVSSVEDAPVSPPPSSAPQPPPSSCKSVCAVSQSCSDEGRKMIGWSVAEVAEFVASCEEVREHAEAFSRENIDGSSLVLLTDAHLTSMGVKLGPAIKFR